MNQKRVSERWKTKNRDVPVTEVGLGLVGGDEVSSQSQTLDNIVGLDENTLSDGNVDSEDEPIAKKSGVALFNS